MESKIFEFEAGSGITLEQYADFGSLPKIYADGASQIFIQNGIVNILFYQNTGISGTNAEVATAVVKISVPVSASLELASGLQTLIKDASIAEEPAKATVTEENQKSPLGTRIA